MSSKIKQNKRREEFFEKFRKSKINESDNLVTKKVETDSLAAAHDKYTKTYRPSINVKNPETFCFFGSCQQYYLRAADYIANYYPFDGTREEIIGFHQNASVVDLAVFNQLWPSAVGHMNFLGTQKIDFSAGPNKMPEVEFVGKTKHGEAALLINPEAGTTIEFWMKKDSFDANNRPEEVVLHVGTYPGKLQADEEGSIIIRLVPDSGASPLLVTYVSGGSSIQNLQVGSSSVTDESVADSAWHHYAFVIWKESTELKVKLYIDGAPDSTVSSPIGDTIALTSFLAGSIGGEMNQQSGNLVASIDEFRFWRGKRSTRDIARFFDKKIYASDTSNEEYTSRLGVYYRFNKPPISNSSVDSIIVDHSGNEVFGRVQNYEDNNRVLISAITQSENTENEEPPDPILDTFYVGVEELISELRNLGMSYDANNQSMLERFIPDWAREEINNSDYSNPSDFQSLLHLMSSEFDDIKLILDSILVDRIPNWQESNQNIQKKENTENQIEINYADNIYMGCDDSGLSMYQSSGFKADRWQRLITAAGIIYERLNSQNSRIEDEVEGQQDYLITEIINSEVKNMLEARIAHEALSIKKSKGTIPGLGRIYSTLGQNNTDITDMQLAPDADLFLEDKKLEETVSEMNSVSFVDNNEGTLFMFSEADDEKSNVPGDTLVDSQEYTFEGCFIFPSQESYTFSNLTTSLFGCREVDSEVNSLTVLDPDNANFTITMEKQGLESKRAKFILNSTALLAESIETKTFNDVYDNSRWHIFVRIRKLSAEPFIELSQEEYEIVFTGFCYVQEHLVNYFEESSVLQSVPYLDFKNANKTFFIGAERENLTGAVINKADSKVLTFAAWKLSLSDEELKLKSQNPTVSGNSFIHILER